MQDALIFVIRTLVDLYIITFVLRLIMHWIRADARNPLSQFVLRVTDPLVVPVRRVVPTAWGFDTPTFIVMFAIQALTTTALLNMTCLTSPDIGQILAVSLVQLLHLVLNIYFFLILAYVILSWVASGAYNPAVLLLTSIVEPVLRPFRRWIPPIGGLDLSPLFVFIAIGALMRLLPAGRVVAGLVCTSLGGLI